MRYLVDNIKNDLQEKMVFLGGPRQVGKTTLAKTLINTKEQYLTYDKSSDRRAALKGEWPVEKGLIVLDEFHKYTKWKNWLKGEFDTNKERFQFLLTGSARLNVYRRGGDSLLGRYHYYRLHPFTLAEAAGSNYSKINPRSLVFSDKNHKKTFEALLKFGGFPEPFFKQEQKNLNRWQNERIERLIQEDIRDLTQIKDLATLEILAQLLPEKIGSPLSINSIRKDLDGNHKTISKWLDTFEFFYYQFRIASFQSKFISAVKKEKKLYLWDWSTIKDIGPRLENLVASHLLKFVHFYYDSLGEKFELNYLRDESGREVDFLITLDKKPYIAVEVKNSATEISSSLRHFKNKLKIERCYQLHAESEKEYVKEGIHVMPVHKFLSALT